MRWVGAVGVILLLSSTTAAHAVSITNRDEHDHKLTIIEGDVAGGYPRAAPSRAPT